MPTVEASAVFADRVVGKPYLEIEIDRKAIARYGLTIEDMQRAISVAIGGMKLTTTVEGRERFPVRVRYAREYRDNPEDLKRFDVEGYKYSEDFSTETTYTFIAPENFTIKGRFTIL